MTDSSATPPENARPPVPRWIRAGWLIISAGFLLAFVCAVVLAQQPRGLEKLFSDLHRVAAYTMLAGLVCLGIGYRLVHFRRQQAAALRERREQRQAKALATRESNELVTATVVPAAKPPVCPAGSDPTALPPASPIASTAIAQQEWSHHTSDGQRLYGRTWNGVEIKATVVLLHGLSDHIARYHDLAVDLCRRGYRVIGYDQRGHGNSSGKRGHAPSFRRLLVDLLEIWESRVLTDGNPIFLYGHSLGGCQALNFAMRPPARCPRIDGVVASSPLLLPANPIPAWKERTARIANRVFPQLSFSTAIDPWELTHNAEVVSQLRQDPFWHRTVTARLGVEMLAAGEWALEHAASLHLPTLMMHGGQDSLTSLQACREFVKRNPQYCRLVEFPEMRHELHHELGNQVVYGTIGTWLDERTAATAFRDSESLQQMQ